MDLIGECQENIAGLSQRRILVGMDDTAACLQIDHLQMGMDMGQMGQIVRSEYAEVIGSVFDMIDHSILHSARVQYLAKIRVTVTCIIATIL